MGGLVIGLREIAVVELILVEQGLVGRVDFCRNDLCLFIPLETMPTFLAIPGCVLHAVIVEPDLEMHRHHEVTLTLHDHDAVEGNRTFLLEVVLPIQAERLRAHDAIVENLRSFHSLVPVPGEILPGNFVHRIHEIFFGWMGELVTLEPGMDRLLHLLFADDAFQRQQHGSGLAVGDSAVGIRRHVVPGIRCHWVEIGDAGVAQSLLGIVAHGCTDHVEDVRVLPVKCGENLHFGVAVNTLVKPGILELIRGHHAVPVLVTKLMFDNSFRHVFQSFGDSVHG